MKITSKLFDRIKIPPSQTQTETVPVCEWEGCAEGGAHRAPKGREREGEYYHFCLNHVRLYNKSYNYFAGMKDEAVEAYQKAALTGHRPTWTMGVKRWGGPAFTGEEKTGEEKNGSRLDDPFGMFGGRYRQEHRHTPPKRRVSALAERAFETLDLDVTASKEAIKARFKLLVKRHHPDAHGGDRASEDRLRQIIQAYNYLKTAGFC